MDSNFHIEHLGVQPLPFAEMHDDYPMLNGRGYPDTVDPDALPPVSGGDKETSGVTSASESSQVVHTRIEATRGPAHPAPDQQPQRDALLHARDDRVADEGDRHGRAHPARPGGVDLSYGTSSVTLGGGESADVLIDTAGVAPGTYLLYSTNLEALSNAAEDFGGMMTEIVISTVNVRETHRMKRQFRFSATWLAPAVLLLSQQAPAEIPASARAGDTTTSRSCTFNLTARAGHITLGDANQLLAWGYGAEVQRHHMQYPGPTLIVNQGDIVTVNLHEQAAGAGLDRVSRARRAWRRPAVRRAC